MGQVVCTRPGALGQGRPRIFTENGGCFCYEALPYAPHGGLIEGGTPECRGPAALLLYQRANDALIAAALPEAQRRLAVAGYPGTLGVLKNCRDAEGHTYGAQENYEAEQASGLALWAYRAGLAALSPLLLVQVVLLWALALVFGVIFLGFSLVVGLLAGLALALLPDWAASVGQRLRHSRALTPWFEDPEAAWGRVAMVFEMGFMWPLTTTHATLLRLTFRRIRRDAVGFLASRAIITGAGTLFEDERFGLSEKGPAIRRLIRTSVHPDNRPLFDAGNLMKGIALPFLFQFRPFFSLFRRRQRLQLGLSDSNMAQVAEYLKVGTTSLVISAAEAGALADGPRPVHPVEALHAWIADPGLKATAPVWLDGQVQPMTALEVQRACLNRISRWLDAVPAPAMEAFEITRLWRDALDTLESDPAALVGRLDWISKRALIEGAGPGLGYEGRKTLDLRYHELEEGYLARMEARGLAPTFVSVDEIEAAMRTPPEDTPAKMRGQLIQTLSGQDLKVAVSWDHVRIGGPLKGRVVRLADYRARSER